MLFSVLLNILDLNRRASISGVLCCQQQNIKQKEEQGTVEQDFKTGKEMTS